MIKRGVLLALALPLAGCLGTGTPVERLSEVQVPVDTEASVAAVETAEAPDAAELVAELLAQTSDSAEPASPDDAAATGLGRLAALNPFRRNRQEPPKEVFETPPLPVNTPVESAEEAPAAPQVEPIELAPETPDVVETKVAAAAPAPRGLFARLRGSGRQSQDDLVDPAKAQTVTEGAPDETGEAVKATPVAARRAGIFGGTARKPAEPETTETIAPNKTLPYGSLATVCGLSNKDLGKEVARYPERGTGYRIYDSAPGSLALRSHYITGFKDGCARKFSAALALFGSPMGHEATRYARSHRHIDLTRTDREYEALRAKTCRAPVGKDCPKRLQSRLEKETVFVSVYERFGTNPRWADMLIHKGRVVAKDFKGD